jgi:hypothetical protein
VNNVRRWSPFNLTHPDIATLSSGEYYIRVAPRNTINNDPVYVRRYFTQYPTQAGAYFQWAGGVGVDLTGTQRNFARKAWTPAPATIPIWSGGSGTVFDNRDVWTDFDDLHETCPPGWRRPTDGVTDAFVSINFATAAEQSQMRQSLWWEPGRWNATANVDEPNVVSGFYADGFFDRRPRSQPPGVSAQPNSTVDLGLPTVAHMGAIFVNPFYPHNHLFIPATGARSHMNSGFLYAGERTHFMGSSTSNTDHIRNMLVLMVGARGGTSLNVFITAGVSRALAGTIRCVRDVPGTPP